MKKIMVYAYTKVNLGDDLFIKILCDRYPNVKFRICAPSQYKDIFKNTKNLKCYSSESIFVRIINFIARKLFKNINFFEKFIALICDAGVYIGGSLFIQGENWENYMNTYIKPKKIKNKPFYLLGANFGPYNDEQFYYKHKEIFKGYTDICFREKYSYDLFRDFDNVRFAEDIIFGYKKKDTEEKNQVAISVIKPSYRAKLKEYDSIYYDKVRDIAIEYINNGMKVVFISFCKSEGDEEAIKDILGRIPDMYKDKVGKYYYRGNIDNTVNLLAESKYIVATRFHAMILGWVFNKHVLPIVYSSKMTNVMNDVGFEGIHTCIENINNFDVKKVINNIGLSKINISNQIINSEKHFEHLDKYIYKDNKDYDYITYMN